MNIMVHDMDVQLVKRARNKDEQAYAKLIDLTSKKLYYTACTCIDDKDDAKNIVQDVYRNCFEKMYQLKDDSKFEGWIMVSLMNKCRDYNRKKHKHDELINDQCDEEDFNFESNIEDERMEFKPDANFNYQELKEGLQGVLNELPEVQRMSIILVHLDGLKVKEAAVALQVPEGTIKSSISLGKQKIKNKIEELRKQNKSFYAVAPMPFLVWMLKEEMEKTSVPVFVVHASSIQPPKLPKKATTGKATSTAIKKAVTSTATKTAASTATKVTAGKVIVGVVATAVIGSGAIFGGYTVTKKVADDSINHSSSENTTEIANVENINYKILDTKVPDFEMSPVDLKNDDDECYFVKVNGLYGVIDSDGKYIMQPEYIYSILFEADLLGDDTNKSNVCLANDEAAMQGDSLENALGKNDLKCGITGYGGTSNQRLTFDEGEYRPYLIQPSENFDTQVKTYDWKESLDHSMIVYEKNHPNSSEYYIVLYGENKVIGPYDKDEVATFSAYSRSTNDVNVYNLLGKVYGLIYEKVDDGYIIWNAKGTKHTDMVFDKVTVISDRAMKVEKDGQMGIVDKDLNLVYMGDFEDVSLPIDGKAYVKIKGEWKQIQLLDN